jgi:hypothetical protein
MLHAAFVSCKGRTAASFLIKILTAKPIRLQDGFEIDVINSSVGEMKV